MARSSSSANRSAAIVLRSAYQTRASRASSTAAVWSSIGSGAILFAPDLLARLGPWNHFRFAGIDFFDAPSDLLRPGLIDVRIGRPFHALIKRLSNIEAIAFR